MKFKSKFFEVYIESLGLELPEYQTRQNQDDSRECFIPACLDAAYKIVIKNTNKVMMAFTVKIDGRNAFPTARFVSPDATMTVIGFDAGKKVEGRKVIQEVHEFVFGRPQVRNGAANNNALTVSSGTIEITAHPTSFLREEVRLVQSSSFEVADVSVRSLNELTMKHFTDGEKVTTKAGTKKQSGWYSVNEDSRSTFSIYDVDYRTKFVQVNFKYRDLYSLLQKNIVPVQELKDMLAKNSALLKLFKDHYDIKNKLKFIQEQEIRYGANSHVKATRRLLKDLRELQLNPLPTIAASPLDDNLLLWHANLHGTKGSPFEGLIFHLELLFNEDYPFEPPRVQMLNFLAHSNVIHGFICLDMLVSGDFVADQNKAYTGWSSAYSLLSVLLQLQAFLFDRANMTEDSIAAAKFHQQRFSCSCGHCQSRPWPTQNNQGALSESERVVNSDDTVIVPVIKPKEKTSVFKIPIKTKKTTNSAKVTLTNAISKPSRFMKAIRCNPKAIILPILAAAALPNIYKHAWKYSSSMEEINSAMLKGVEKLTEIKAETLKTLPTISSMSFSISPNMVFMMKIFGVIICIGLVQWLFIASSAKNRTQRIRNEEAKLNRAQLEVKKKQKAEKERKLAKQMQKVKMNRDKEFNAKLRRYYGDDIEDSAIETIFVSKKLVTNNAYIIHEQDEFFESPAKVKKEQRREARIKAVLNAKTAAVKPSEVPKNRNTGVNGVQIQIDRKTGRPIRKSKFARNSNSTNRNRSSEDAPQSKNRYSVHDESTEESFMEKQLLLMNHSLIDMMHSTSAKSNTNNTSAQLGKKLIAIFPSLPNEILLEIFSYLNHTDIMSIARVCTPFRTLAFDGFLWDRRELVCFHSKVTFEEDVLGVGLNVEYYPDSDRLSAITSPLDLLSHTAFRRDQVRSSVWKTKFKFFMPLYINRMHGQKAIPLVNESLVELLKRPFEPLMALEVFPKLMNTMVVELMDRKLHASMKALEGFCFFHRLLIEYTLRYPEVLKKVESTIENFINNRRARTKKSVPNLGEFLTLLTVSQKYAWEDVCDIYIEEQLVRNVKWVVQALPNWNQNFDTLSKENAMLQFLNATQVSKRLLIFNYYFLKDVAKTKISHGDVNYIKQNYDLHYGKPSLTIRNEFHNAVKYIQKLDISKWNVFFHHLGLGAPSNNTIYQWIAQARKISALRKYHK